MFCKHCGGKLVQEVKFCTFCGKEAPVEETSLPNQTPVETIRKSTAVGSPVTPRKSKGRYLLFGISGAVLGAILLAGILFATGVLTPGNSKKRAIDLAKSGGTSIEGAGYDTPEEAAEAYLEALRDQDLDAMIATFAVESYVGYYDFEAGIEWLKSYNPYNALMPYPNTGEYTIQLNIATRRDQIATDISWQYLLHEELSDGMTIGFEDKAEIQDFVAEIEKKTESYVFEDLKITGTMPPEDLSDLYLSENVNENIARWANVIGVDAEDVVNIVITFEADGKTWVFCPRMVKYENKWYIENLTGNLSYILGLTNSAGGIIYD